MPKMTFTPEQVVGKLPQTEVLINQGKTVSQAAEDRITDQTVLSLAQRIRGATDRAGAQAQRCAESERVVAACC
jgi:hypothetical protein